MTDFHLWHLVSLAFIVIVSWVSPKKIQMDLVAIATLLFLAIVSPMSALLFFSNTLLIYFTAKHASNKGRWLFCGVVYCCLQFVSIRFVQNLHSDNVLIVIGLAYLTCRQIHFLVESYKGSLRFDFRTYCHYQFFLPVVFAGPINYYPSFQRECQRRRWDFPKQSAALERVIYGYAKVIILGNYLIEGKLSPKLNALDLPDWCQMWAESALDWLYLYTQFSGWSDVAIGFSAMMGIKLNENFNHPLKAKTLIEFWQRWHISLSAWCKEYVFKPVISTTRRPFLAIILSMIVMGVWHELSWYYILWGIYHALGISICRFYQNHSLFEIQNKSGLMVWGVFTQIVTLGYVVSAAPVIAFIGKVMGVEL